MCVSDRHNKKTKMVCNKRSLGNDDDPHACTKCQKIFPQSDFRLTTSGKNKGKAIKSWCKGCERLADARRYRNKRDASFGGITTTPLHFRDVRNGDEHPCTVCHKKLPINSFHLRNKGTTTRSCCKSCHNSYTREHQRKRRNQDKHILSQNIYT